LAAEGSHHQSYCIPHCRGVYGVWMRAASKPAGSSYCASNDYQKSNLCQGTPVVVPTRVNICTSALNKGGSGDPGARSIIGHAHVRTSGIRYIY
jgi:hypothetical protein